MHVHANYSLQLASLGASRNETQEIVAKKSAEVRKKLAIASGALSEAGDGVSAIEPKEEDRQHREYADPEDAEFGRLFSARA